MTLRKDIHMVYTLKFEGKKYAYDSATGAVVALSSLLYKMIEALEPPLEPICPTSLRYELAKYDSNDVSDAYDSILEYAKDGLLYGKEDGIIRLMCDNINEQLAAELLSKAFSTCNGEIKFLAVGEQTEWAKQLALSLGNPILL